MVWLPPGSILHRFYTAAFDPIFFDTSRAGRFNAPNGSYGVLYAAREVEGAFAETFLRSPGATMLDLPFVNSRAYVRIETRSRLKLTKLSGAGLAILGATAEVVQGSLPYDVSQAWSLALASHPAGIDGIAYFGRLDNEMMSYALFDRARPAIREVDRRTDLDTDWFWEIAARYRIGLSPD